FFFQAEDGIRDWSVTGVQTCALPISVEEFYGSPVDVRVMNCRRSGNEYARKILLTLKNDPHRVVQFGLVRINLGVCPEPVRNAKIGRASCRERVGISVVGECVRENEK